MVDIGTTVVALAGAVALAGFFSGITGFGFNLLATPVLLLAYPPHTAVQIALILGLAISVALLLSPGVAEELDYALLRMLTVWGFVGVPVGALLFVQANPDFLAALIGAIVMIYALVVLLARNIHWIRHRRLGRSAGLLSGALAASTGLSGPPIVLYVHAHRPTGRYFRANVAAYVAILSVVSLTSHALIGGLTFSTVTLSVVLTPAALLGMAVGTFVFPKMSPRAFDRLVLGILIVVGLATLASALT